MMKPLRVMIVEDEPWIALLLAETLTGIGHDVCSVESTEDGAVTSALRFSPELMIVDLHLRQGSGITAIEEILRGGFIAHIVMSSDRLHSHVLHPRTVWIRKPFFEFDLVRAIQDATAMASPFPQIDETAEGLANGKNGANTGYD